MRRIALHPLATLCFFGLVLAACLAVYLLDGRDPSEDFQIVASGGWALLVLCWITFDANRLRNTPCYDFGFLCTLFFPLSLPWYCFWSRGWRGVMLLCVLVTSWIAPYFVAALAVATLFGLM